MRNISQDFRREYIKGNRNYDITINLTLADGETEITLTNEDIWQGGFSFEESISDSNSFDIGDAIIGKCTIILDNINERFSRYDFFNATMWVYIGLHGLDEQPIRIGYYTVDETSYNGSLITLNCLDNLWRFDTPFSNITLTYPCTIRDIIEEMCEYSGIGITLATQTFHNYNFTINTAPDGDLNCREVLQYLAQICCCYCKINSQGNLELRWIDKTDITGISNYDGGTFNTTTTPYSDGDSLDGGDFTDYSSGDTADGGLFYNSQDTFGYIVHNSQMQVGTDDIWITGVRVCSNDTNSENGYDVLWVDTVLEQTHERYVLVIQENPFINANNATVIATDIGSILAGTPIRSFNSTSLSDISIEVGDPCQINDFRGNAFYTWVTNIKFVSDGYESFSCGAESIMSNKTVRYSDTVKTLVEAKRNAQEIVSVYDQAVKNMNDLAQEALGYHEYKYTVLGADIMWRYSGEDIDTTDPSHPLFEDSDTVFKISADGVFISTDGGVTYTNGYDANSGTAILNLLYANGLSSDWIHTGTLKVGGVNNEDGMIWVCNKDVANSGSIDETTISRWIPIGKTQISEPGTYRIRYEFSDIEVGKTFSARYIIYHTSDGGTSWDILTEYITVNSDGEFPIDFTITDSSSDYYQIYFSKVSGNANYTVSFTFNKPNTVIDNRGIETSNIKITGGEIAGASKICGLSLDDSSHGMYYQGKIIDIDFYYRTDAWNGFTAGRKKEPEGESAYWTRMDYSQYWAMLKIDYGRNKSLRGLVVTAVGNNSDDDPGNNYCNVLADGVHTTSDRRRKKNIKSLSTTFAKKFIDKINPVQFKYKDSDENHFGFVAQEVEEILPENNSAVNYDKNLDVYMLNYQEMIAPICAVVKTQQEEIELLKKEIKTLKERMDNYGNTSSQR